ncbi:MULE domain-containing protein, partial [Aphis craccivora]
MDILMFFCLLPNKYKQTYIYVFRAISKKCKDLGLNLSPTNITVDFERAIINAVSEMWMQTNISGCRFHLTQSWYRKIQEIGLSSVYKDESSEI